MANWKRIARKKSGGALVEFALTLPLLTVLLLGAFELARVAYAAIQVANASRAGAQYGAQNGSTAADTPGMITAASNEASSLQGLSTDVLVCGICASGASCTGAKVDQCGNKCINTDCQTTSGDHIETILHVTSSVSFTPEIRLGILPNSFTLQHTTVQKCLNCE